MYDQREIKLVLFSPTSDHFAVDVYVDGNRVHCGRGHFWESDAINEALNFIDSENVKMSNSCRLQACA